MSKSTKSKKRQSQRKDLRVVYPEYFDKNLSMRLGRRVPLKLAYDEPEVKRVALAAQKVGYEVFLDSEKHYSRTWYNKQGRVLIGKVGSKEEQLREIAKNLSKVNLPRAAKKKTPTKKKPKKGSVYRQKTK